MTGFLLIFLLIAFVVTPFLISYDICKARHRSIAKGMVVTFFFGWLATVGLWLALKTRDPKTRQLY